MQSRKVWKMLETDQFSNVCKDRFDEIISRFDTLDNRLFHDNGVKSIQSRINDNTLWCSVMKWFTVTMSGGFFLGLIGLAFWIARKIV